MATLKFLCFLILQLFLVANCEGVEVGFYNETCPNVEIILKETTKHYISIAPTLAAPLLRMHFHDCFVRGCDGSVLLNSTKGNKTEKDEIPNQSLRGFQVIDATKSALEKECPGIVSCSDILALTARDAVSMINGPTWPVPLGRRDGIVLILLEASKNLPTPFDNFTTLKTTFGALGLNVKDLVVLSALLTNTQTKDYVLSQLYLHGSTFFKDFGESMVKMRQIGVLTGKAGEIRKHRAFRN
uniref:peroxidase n=1 Tax=Solanum tuberosum TaxID=4113 RepID=M1BVU0_SOLTU